MSSIFTTLISATELARNINNVNEKSWVILDCRHDLLDVSAGRDAYAVGHIPTAQFAHLDDDLSGSKMDEQGVFHGRHPLPDKSIFLAKLRSWGVNDDTQVIVYDAHGGMFAARCWWMLRWVGHAAVAVLDGGISAWSGALTNEVSAPQQGTVNERKSLVGLVNVNDVLSNVSSQQLTLLDARSPDRFRGENETIDKIGGHIPGAKNRFFKDNLTTDGFFKTPQQLREDFSAIVSHPEKSVMQCGSGVTACHNLLALEIAEMPGAALYVGSWSEWCADPARPVEVG